MKGSEPYRLKEHMGREGFTFPATAVPWPDTEGYTIEGIRLSPFIYQNPEWFGFGRIFWTDPDRRIFLVCTKKSSVPYWFEVDGIADPRLYGTGEVMLCAQDAVRTMLRRDGVHDEFDEELATDEA